MRAFVTGGGGFLGQAIVKQLLAQGHEVISYSRGEYPQLQALGARHIQGDLSDPARLEQAMQSCEAVFHVAAKAGIWGTYQDYYQTNVQGTAHVLKACQNLGIPRLIHTSSPSVVFHRCGIEGADESLPYPQAFEAYYPQTKALAEQMVLKANSPQLSTVALRPHLIWGPGDHHFLPRLVERARAGRLRLVGQQPHLVDSIYIDNAARAHLLACQNLAPAAPAAGKAYFISQGQPIPIQELINQILAAAGAPQVTRSIPPGLAYWAGALMEGVYAVFKLPGEPLMTRFLARQLSTPHWFNMDAARRDLGYEPTVSIAEGMGFLREWIEGGESVVTRLPGQEHNPGSAYRN